MRTDRAVYVYAIVDHSRTPRLPRRGGVPGARPPRALALQDRRWAIVADVPADGYSPDAVRSRLADLEWVSACALGHERVAEALLECRAVAPMRLFTVFRDDATLVSRLRRSTARLDRTLTFLRGRLECGVRVFVVPGARRAQRPPSTGTAFLAARAALVKRPDAPTPAQSRGTAALLRDLAALADRSRVRRAATPESPLARSAQFLVARENLRTFGAAVNQGRRSLRALGLEVALLGPYPAYSFI